MIVTSEGIVLKQKKIVNNRRMLTVFTKNYGKLSAGTTINERGKNKSAAAIRPFALSEYELYKGRDSYSVNSAQLKNSYFALGADLDRFMAASQLLEYLDKILEEGQPKPKIYDMTLEFLDAMIQAEGNYETLLYAFIVKTFRFLGVMPELKNCVNCGKEAGAFGYPEPSFTDKGANCVLFSVSSGGIICEECAKREKSEGNSLIYEPSFDIITVLCYFIDQPLGRFAKVRLKPAAAEEIRRILGDYIDRYLGVNVLNKEIQWG